VNGAFDVSSLEFRISDAAAMTYLTPKVDGNGVFAGDLTPLGNTIDASGGWRDAGDYLKCPVQRVHGGLSRQRPGLLKCRAGDRSDGVLAAGVCLAGRRVSAYGRGSRSGSTHPALAVLEPSSSGE
jgi:hypothetical protein